MQPADFHGRAMRRLVRKKNPAVGYATIYRTLRLLCQSGLCRELKFEDGTTRYEHLYGHEHHDHLICIRCGRFVEVVDLEIEERQKKNFIPMNILILIQGKK